MKKFLLPEGGTWYKANLHCHSTFSDGKLTPAQLKEIYMEKGYSIIAYTDHNVMIDNSHLTDEDFLALVGYELDVSEPYRGRPAGYDKTCHFCAIAIDPKDAKQVCYHREKYCADAYRHLLKYDENEPDYVRVYNVDCVNDMMKRARDAGFYVTYNHPAWSLENYEQYAHYEHMHAMEICNYGCVAAGYPDYVPQIYDDILRTGKRIFCIATDDNHNAYPADSRDWDSFGGFTVIKADKLDYPTIMQALLNGNFYASQGPAIHDLWYEDGEIHVTCSDADRIILNAGRRKSRCRFAENGKLLTEASFAVDPTDLYVRITVIDEKGYPANTNAYFVDELLK